MGCYRVLGRFTEGLIDLVLTTTAQRSVGDERCPPVPGDAIVCGRDRHTRADGRCWYVDPIAGTTNFAHGIHSSVLDRLYDARNVVVDRCACWAGRECARAAQLPQWRALVTCRDSGWVTALLSTGFPYDSRLQSTTTSLVHAIKRVCARTSLRSAALVSRCRRRTDDAYWNRAHAWTLRRRCARCRAGGPSASCAAMHGPTLRQLIASNGQVTPTCCKRSPPPAPSCRKVERVVRELATRLLNIQIADVNAVSR